LAFALALAFWYFALADARHAARFAFGFAAHAFSRSAFFSFALAMAVV
jgi:hypothetical protein